MCLNCSDNFHYTDSLKNVVYLHQSRLDSWAIADLLRGDFKQSQYGRIILPFALLRRLECVLEESKEAVLAKAEEVAAEQLLIRATHGLNFVNTSKMDLSKLGE